MFAEFNSQPTGGVRPCEFYTFKAKAIFDHGFTESVTGALHEDHSKVRLFFLISENDMKNGVISSVTARNPEKKLKNTIRSQTQ